MNRQISQISSQIAIAAIASVVMSVSPTVAQSLQPQKGDADLLRPSQGQSITPTNSDQFSPENNLPSSSLQIQNINFEVEEIQPVIPGNNNAAPEKVNRSGSFSSDPLHAIQIFKESGSTPKSK